MTDEPEQTSDFPRRPVEIVARQSEHGERRCAEPRRLSHDTAQCGDAGAVSDLARKPALSRPAAVVPDMKARGSGSILFIGATASRRGGAKTVAFASAKAAQRSLAESLARHLWPHGIHVALVIVDGIVDEPLMRAKLTDKPDDFFVKPEDIADTLVSLTWQRRSAWSFEVEARPFGETW